MVTAQRVETNVQRTPIAMDVINSDLIKSQGITGVASLATVSPSLAISGTAGGTVLTVRGISSRDTTEIGDPAVVVSVDGFYQDRSYALGLTQYNILSIILAPLEDPTYKELRDIAQVTYMLKSPSIGIISEADEAVAEQVDDVFRLDETDPILFSILAILPGQLLPYWGAVAQGNINPDTQRANIPRHAKVWNWLFPKDTH